MSFEQFFTKAANRVAHAAGMPASFIVCCLIVLVWAVSGPVFGFSDTWQLIINTGTTIVTFLMVFVIQNTQNRDNLAMNIKLDVMMRKLGITAQELVEAEDESDKDLEKQKTKVQNGHGPKKHNRKSKK